MLAAGEDTTLLAVEEDILVEGHRVETLVFAGKEDSHQKVGIDPRVAVVEVATADILLDLVDWCCRARRWIPSLDQCLFENDPRCLTFVCAETMSCVLLTTTSRCRSQTIKNSPVLVSPMAFCALCALSPI